MKNFFPESIMKSYQVSIFFLIFFLYCYEYSEEIVLYSDFSGLIQLKYSVPISKKDHKSYFSFLPSTREDFVAYFETEPTKFNFSFISKDNYDLGIIEAEIQFRRIEDFKNKLIGMYDVIQIGNSLVLKRNFKSIENLALQNKLYHYFYEFFFHYVKGKNLSFFIKIPKHFNLTSNLGDLPYPGVLVFIYPLERTMESKSNVEWVITIKSNPFP